jgi:hypothetical protein
MIKVLWEQLQCCHLGGLVNDCLERLQLTMNMEECLVVLSCLPPHGPLTPVRYSRLRSITIRGDPTHLLGTLIAPALHNISIIHMDTPWRATEQLTSVISQCSLHMSSLSCNKHHPNANDLIQFIHTSPALLELHILGCTSRAMNEWFLALFAHLESPNALHLVPMVHTNIPWSGSTFKSLPTSSGYTWCLVY